jgi:hypothetical protein
MRILKGQRKYFSYRLFLFLQMSQLIGVKIKTVIFLSYDCIFILYDEP